MIVSCDVVLYSLKQRGHDLISRMSQRYQCTCIKKRKIKQTDVEVERLLITTLSPLFAFASLGSSLFRRTKRGEEGRRDVSGSAGEDAPQLHGGPPHVAGEAAGGAPRASCLPQQAQGIETTAEHAFSPLFVLCLPPWGSWFSVLGKLLLKPVDRISPAMFGAPVTEEEEAEILNRR
ncbi:hypothetical protein B296_00028914 [Ensete ventricosum]|uniref:Uncharacterized protein n=1 Tax=Ensete ventricosum TaxID=4639 RepID=A0A426XVE2_ENSVE|nr:hypothetical protein B296_00028914 [Ensete ventricosum]